MTYVNIGIGVFLLLIGLLVKKFPDLIAGYNTMSSDRKKEIDIDHLSSFMRNGFLLMGATIIVGSFLFRWLGIDVLVQGLGIVIILAGTMILAIFGQQFDKNMPVARRNSRISFTIIISLGVVIGTAFFYGLRSPEIDAKNSILHISGIYGINKNIVSIEVIDSLPEISLRTNGMQLGQVSKGNFRLEDGRNAKLFLESRKGPFIKALAEEQLSEMENPMEQSSRWSPQRIMEWRAAQQMRQKRDSFLMAEGVELVLMGAVGKHGTLFTGSRRDGRLMDTPRDMAVLDIAPEFFNLLKRFSDNGEAATVEAEVQTSFYDEDLQGYNVIAEIPGSDKKLKEEIVMLGAHLDSWHGATGATDNGAGSVVMLEAMRILKESGLLPKRTIRLGLWGGEEQGLHGSRNYVKNTFGDAETMKMTKEHGKFSAYYNIDNGTGRIRGIYLQGNENVRSIFDQWFEPFDDIVDNRTITIRNTGGTDHLAFDGVGLPGFQFIQDPVEYGTRTHHTNMDTYDRLVVEDLQQIATIVAAFVYNTAMREEKMPRKEEELERGK